MKTEEKLSVAEGKLEEYVQNWLNDKADDYDDESIKAVLGDLFHSGCASGFVSNLIYYKDTSEFYNNFVDEIWDLMDEQYKEMGYKNIMELIASLNGSDNVGSDEQLKNLLAWYAFEETARTLANKAEIDI